MGTSGWELFSHPHAHRTSSDASLFSSSLPVLANKSLNHYNLKHDLHAMDDTSPSLNDIDQELDRNKFLPDDEDELLAGIMDGFEASWLPNLVDDLEECDVFGSGGGLELESDPQENLRVSLSNVSLSDESFGNGAAHFNQTGVGTIVGEHPLGEHPSRTLFVRNINSNVEDAEIRTLFELYGDIRTMYTACKHRGFVMISYYDIRAARTAMRALQNKPLLRRKLDIHFSIPKENPSDKDINQGTLVVFNLDQSVSNDDLLQIFGAYGEVKEIRETPHKRHHKFIEFYDVRAAESALKSLNKSDIAGKRIKVEHSRPGGARRSNLLHLNHELEKDEWTSHKVGSLPHFGSANDRNPLQSFSISPGLSSLSASASSSLSPHTFEMSHSLPEHKLSRFTGSDPFIGSSTFNGSSHYWGNSELYSEPTNSPLITQATRHSFVSSRNNGFPIPNLLRNFSNWSQIGQQYPHYQPGSAPSTIPLKQNIGYFRESPGVSFLGHGCEHITRSYRGELSSHDISNAAHVAYSGHFPGAASSNFEALAERGIEVDIKKQFQLDLDKIRSGDDIRTTLMIKNIPNKYTSKMLMAAIDEHHKGTYDFLYLPIDFKNKCNVGYAFINLLSPLNIIPFYKAFYGKKWEKFNSEKVATLAYARIQGKAALISHFQHTSLMSEDKRCRPILLDSEFDDKIFQENVRVDQPNGSGPGNLPGKMWTNDVDDQGKR